MKWYETINGKWQLRRVETLQEGSEMKLIQGYLHKDCKGKWSAILDITGCEHYSIFDYKSKEKVMERAVLVAKVLGCEIKNWKRIGEEGKDEQITNK